MKKEACIYLKLLFLLFILVPFISAADIDTLIVVNGGDISHVDASIAAGISADIGVPVLYTNKNEITTEIIKELDSGAYKDVTNVVILGGEAVVHPQVEETLRESGSGSGGYEVTRIAGVTGTGTAVEAIKYFYGPEVLDEVTLVNYNGDNDKTYNDVLQLSTAEEKPVIPIVGDVNGLPADVVETLDTLGIDKVNLIGDFNKEKEIKIDLDEVNVKIDIEIDGNKEEVEKKIQDDVKNTIKSGDIIVLAEEGSVLPIIPDRKIVFVRDENGDGIEDDTGSVLDGIGLGLGLGRNVKVIFLGSKDVDILNKVLEERGIKGEGGQDPIKVAIEILNTESDRIINHFKEKDGELEEKYKEHEKDFEKKLPGLIEQFKVFYTIEKDKLSKNALELGAKVIDEANKNDAVAQWKFMHAFANEYQHENYILNCKGTDCANQAVELEKANVEEKLDKLIGTEKAKEVANLEVGKKVGLLELGTFVPPGMEDGFKQKIGKTGEKVKIDSLHDEYIKEIKEEAYKHYIKGLSEEYKAISKEEDPTKYTDEQIKTKFEERLTEESKAHLAGIMTYSDFSNIEKRAKILNGIEAVDNHLEYNGIKDNEYLTPEAWKAVYEKYIQEGRSLNDPEVKAYKAAVVAYKVYEEQHLGEDYSPKGGSYDDRSGRFTYIDKGGELISGVYNKQTETYTYTDPEGHLIEGSHSEIKEYSKENVPGGWTQKSDGTWTSPEGKIYTPPAQGEYKHDATSGTTTYTYTAPGGWTQKSDGTWASPEGTTYNPQTAYPSSNVGSEGQHTYSYSGDHSGTYSGGSYSGGESSSGTYSGGSYSGGESSSGSPSAPSGGGDGGGHSGGSPTGHVVFLF